MTGPESGYARGMDCPICKSKLSVADHEGVSVDRCPQGCGEFLETGELHLVAQREHAARSDAERAAELQAARDRCDGELLKMIMDEGPRHCPKCDGRMSKIEYGFASAVMIDRCPSHGVWLDTDELQRIEAYAEGERRRLAEKRDRIEAMRESSGNGTAAPSPMRAFAAQLEDAIEHTDGIPG